MNDDTQELQDALDSDQRGEVDILADKYDLDIDALANDLGVDTSDIEDALGDN